MSETPLPTAPTQQSPPSGFSVTQDERTWALVAHALTFIEGGILGPLILYVVKRDESEFVAFHALQSFYFGLIFLLVSVISCGLLALPFLIPYIILEVIACLRAQDGEWYELPIAGAWASQRHNPGTVKAK